MNPTKTEVMWLGASQQVSRINISDITMLSTTIKVTESARDLGVILDAELKCLLTSLHSVDLDSFNSDSYVHSSGHSRRKRPKHWFRRLYLAVWTTATRFCME